MKAKQKPTFALAGALVDTPDQAKRILVDAIHHDKHWLIPQAESVLKQLRNAALIAAAALTLTACAGGDCDPAAVVSPQADTATAVASPAPVGVTEPVTAPTPTPTPTPTPEPVVACPQTTGCSPSPTPAPVRPVVTTPTSSPTCTRDISIALVLVDGFWVDNCGNKYGSTSN